MQSVRVVEREAEMRNLKIKVNTPLSRSDSRFTLEFENGDNTLGYIFNKETAERLAACWNCHEDLLDALKTLLQISKDWIEVMQGVDRQDWQEALDAARNAIKQADPAW